jgi:hypothetical protein
MEEGNFNKEMSPRMKALFPTKYRDKLHGYVCEWRIQDWIVVTIPYGFPHQPSLLPFSFGSLSFLYSPNVFLAC